MLPVTLWSIHLYRAACCTCVYIYIYVISVSDIYSRIWESVCKFTVYILGRCVYSAARKLAVVGAVGSYSDLASCGGGRSSSTDGGADQTKFASTTQTASKLVFTATAVLSATVVHIPLVARCHGGTGDLSFAAECTAGEHVTRVSGTLATCSPVRA